MKAIYKLYLGTILTTVALVMLWYAIQGNIWGGLGIFVGYTGFYIFMINLEDAAKEQKEVKA